MKTVTNGKIVKRVDDITAQENVKKGWQYCPKSLINPKVTRPHRAGYANR